ncbi:MAG: PP2C family protein-serine/threonine phosphatase [Planctomycetota bacterium]
MIREIACTEVWGGTGACDVSVKLAGARGECFSRPYRGGEEGGDIHFLAVCGMSILSKVVLADVSGRGAENAAASRVIHQALVENVGAHDNSTMLRQVNVAFLARRRGDFKFTTMASMILDSRNHSLVYGYAGHPSILLGERATGRFRPVVPEGRARGGVPLGVLPDTDYEQHATSLSPGDVLAVYTDAFTEARDAGGAFLGEAGLARLLESAGTLDPAELKRHVLERIALDDDASLVILEVM